MKLFDLYDIIHISAIEQACNRIIWLLFEE